MAGTLQFMGVVDIVRRITLQITEHVDTYMSCKIETACNQVKEIIKLSVDLSIKNFPKLTIEVRNANVNVTGAPPEWYINNIKVSEATVTYETLFEFFKPLHVYICTTFRYLQIEDETNEWEFQFDAKRRIITVITRQDKHPLFAIGFSSYYRLYGPIVGMLTVHGAIKYDTFNDYDELTALLRKKGFTHKPVEDAVQFESEQMWSAINQLSTILEQTRFTEPSH